MGIPTGSNFQQDRRIKSMKTDVRNAILTVAFTCIFLIMIPTFSDRWPFIFGIACLCLFIPDYLNKGDGRWGLDSLFRCL